MGKNINKTDSKSGTSEVPQMIIQAIAAALLLSNHQGGGNNGRIAYTRIIKTGRSIRAEISAERGRSLSKIGGANGRKA